MSETIFKINKPKSSVAPFAAVKPQTKGLLRGDRARITRFCNDVIGLAHLSETMSAKNIPAFKAEMQLLKTRAKKLARLAQHPLKGRP